MTLRKRRPVNVKKTVNIVRVKPTIDRRRPVSETREIKEKPVTKVIKPKTVTKVTEEKPVSEVVKPISKTKEIQEKPVTEVVRPISETTEIKKKPTTRVLKPISETKVIEEKPVTKVVKPISETKVIEEKPVTEVVKPISETKVIEEKPVTEVVKPISETKVIEEKPVTEVVKPISETKVIEEKPVTEVVKPISETKVIEEKPVTKVVKPKTTTKVIEEKPVTRVVKPVTETKEIEEKPVIRVIKAKTTTKVIKKKPVTVISRPVTTTKVKQKPTKVTEVKPEITETTEEIKPITETTTHRRTSTRSSTHHHKTTRHRTTVHHRTTSTHVEKPKPRVKPQHRPKQKPVTKRREIKPRSTGTTSTTSETTRTTTTTISTLVTTLRQWTSLQTHGVQLLGRTYITFEVMAPRDIHIALSRVSEVDLKRDYEIVIGGGNNQWSGIRRGPKTPWLVKKNVGPLSRTTYKSFFISWEDGVISVGTGTVVDKTHVFITYKDPTPKPIEYAAIRSGKTVTGRWKFPKTCTCLNGGICRPKKQCVCPNGFQGNRCQTPVYKWTTVSTTQTQTTTSHSFVNLQQYGVQVLHRRFLTFYLRANKGVYVSLSYAKTTFETQSYIVGFNDARGGVVIKRCWQGKCSVVSQTKSSIVSATKYQRIWISWTNGLIRVGTGTKVGSHEVLHWQDNIRTFFRVRFSGVSTATNCIASWRLEKSCTCKNFGMCMNIGFRPSCLCVPGYGGKSCEKKQSLFTNTGFTNFKFSSIKMDGNVNIFHKSLITHRTQSSFSFTSNGGHVSTSQTSHRSSSSSHSVHHSSGSWGGSVSHKTSTKGGDWGNFGKENWNFKK